MEPYIRDRGVLWFQSVVEIYAIPRKQEEASMHPSILLQVDTNLPLIEVASRRRYGVRGYVSGRPAPSLEDAYLKV